MSKRCGCDHRATQCDETRQSRSRWAAPVLLNSSRQRSEIAKTSGCVPYSESPILRFSEYMVDRPVLSIARVMTHHRVKTCNACRSSGTATIDSTVHIHCASYEH